MNRIIPVIPILCCILSCSKSSGDDKDREPPLIDLSMPADNQAYTGSQVIRISGEVKDNRYIKEIHIEITDLATAQEYLHVHIHPAATAYFFDQNFTIQPGINYTVRIIADDASSNSSMKKIQIACN